MKILRVLLFTFGILIAILSILTFSSQKYVSKLDKDYK